MEHVHVAAGGQAIVGNVVRRGGGEATRREPRAIANAPGMPVKAPENLKRGDGK